MFTLSNVRLSFLCALLLPTIVQAELTISKDHKAVVDTSDLQLVAPSLLSTVGLPTVVFAILGAAISEANQNVTAGFAAVGGVIGAREYYAYQKAYDAARGLNLLGAAAEQNEEGIHELIKYSNKWLLFKYNDGCTFYKAQDGTPRAIGSPLEVDATGKTALHYAAAVNNVPICKAILAVAPKKVIEFEVAGKSTTTTAPINTVSASGGLSGLASGRINTQATRTTGGQQEHVSQVAKHQTYVDLRDDGGKTAANLAARTHSVKTLLYLAGMANIDELDKSSQSPRTISNNTPEMKAVIDQIEGK